MPLDPSVLTASLRSFMDKDYSGFAGFPVDELDAAARWANAVDAYTGGGANIIPIAIEVVPGMAKAALQAGLSGMSVPLAGPLIFDVAFVAYATTLGVGMAPAFVAVPPIPGTLSVALLAQAALSLPPNPSKSPAEQLPLIAGVFDLWFRTATATPPGGSPVPWS